MSKISKINEELYSANSSIDNSIIHEFTFDDIGDSLKNIGEGIKSYIGSSNQNFISESSFSRLLSKVSDDNKDWAIITAYRAFSIGQDKPLTKDDNIKRNRDLRGQFDKRKMGVYQLVGHWQECQIPNVEYSACPKDKLQDVIERSYLSVKPDDMDSNDFQKLIVDLMTIDGETQDGALIKNKDGINFLDNKNKLIHIGDKVELGKIGQAYSQYIKKQNIPFVFEGLEIPSSNIQAMMMTRNNVNYIDYPVSFKK